MATEERRFAGLRGSLRRDEPLSQHTWWAVGGPADLFYQPADLDDLADFLSRLAQHEPLFWLGLGSNLLVRDGGIRGAVVCTAGALDEIEPLACDGLRTGAGAACPKVARIAARSGLAGLEFMAGIPGTIGGALAMNAGAHGGETWPMVSRVQTVNRIGTLRWRARDEYHFGYREVRGYAGEWFVTAEFKLASDVPSDCDARIRELLRHRSRTQPMGQRSCGSVFRNPPGDHAGRLVEACGLKGRRKGGALVSPRHANFIVSESGCAAADIESLVTEVADTVAAATGVRLQPEVLFVGEPTSRGAR